MDLIDRYLIAVRRHLPRQLQDDVIQELADSLRSEAEEREQATGGPLPAEEQAELLRKRGHPWLMAGRYLPQQQLIGPALYPYYRQALIFVVFWVVLPMALFGGAITALYSEHSTRVWGWVVGAAWNGSIYSVGIVTIIFAVLEHERVRISAFDKWNPMTLPEPSEGRKISRAETLVGLVISLTLLVWWTGMLRVPASMDFAGAPIRIVAAPIWGTLHWPIVLLLLASAAVSLIDLVQPWRTLAVSAADMAIGLAGAGVVILILRAGRYVEVLGDPEFADRVTRANYWLNAAIGWSFMVLGVVLILDVLYEAWLVFNTARQPELDASR